MSATTPQHRESIINEATNKLSLLTRQQINILELSGQGLRNDAIAAQLGLSIVTVKFHKTNIYKLLSVSSITQALIAYQRLTSNVQFEILAPGEYRTPAYSRIKVQLADIKEKYAALVIYSQQQANNYKRLAMDISALSREAATLKLLITKQAPHLFQMLAKEAAAPSTPNLSAGAATLKTSK